MNKETIFQLAKTLDCEYEIGIWSEATDFIERQENVCDFTVTYRDGLYQITIELAEFGFAEVKSLFSSLVSFLEYTSTIYTREDSSDSIGYYLLSSTKDQKAFLCQILFR